MRIIKNILLILTNWKHYKYWDKRKRNVKFHDLHRGAGTYLNVGLFGVNPIGELLESKMKSGKVGIYELVKYETFSDSEDMVKNSWWNFVGYKGIKPVQECNFDEYLELYIPNYNTKYK